MQPWLHRTRDAGGVGDAELPAARASRPAPGPRCGGGSRRLGVAQLSDGLVALPADARTREQLEWLADDVVAAGGTAGVWLARPTTAAQERELADRPGRRRGPSSTGRSSVVPCRHAADRTSGVRALRRLRAEWRAIGRRDFFPPPDAGRGRRARSRESGERLPHAWSRCR